MMDDDALFDPTEAPPQTEKAWNFKKAQVRLAEHGYTLLSYGPSHAMFCRADAERDQWGLLPEEAKTKMPRVKFDKFLRSLGKK